MIFLYSSSPTGSPASRRGAGLSVILLSSVVMFRVVPSSMPSLVRICLGMVTWPLRLTLTWDNFCIVVLLVGLT